MVATEIDGLSNPSEISKLADDYLTGCTHVHSALIESGILRDVSDTLAEAMQPEHHAWWMDNLDCATY